MECGVQVCGGSPQLLRSAASEFARCKDWPAGEGPALSLLPFMQAAMPLILCVVTLLVQHLFGLLLVCSLELCGPAHLNGYEQGHAWHAPALSASFEGKEFKVVARMLLDSPRHAVPWNKLAEAVGKIKGAEGLGLVEQGEESLEAMVEGNVLGYRLPSALA
jgi:hypothetical protein